MNKRFNDLKTMAVTMDAQGYIKEFEVSQEEYDWYEDAIPSAISAHEYQGGEVKHLYFRGIKLVVK